MPKKLPQLELFRRPKDMNLKLGEPHSIRLHSDTEALLKDLAANAGIGFSTLICGIADDYANWYRKERDS